MDKVWISPCLSKNWTMGCRITGDAALGLKFRYYRLASPAGLHPWICLLAFPRRPGLAMQIHAYDAGHRIHKTITTGHPHNHIDLSTASLVELMSEFTSILYCPSLQRPVQTFQHLNLMTLLYFVIF